MCILSASDGHISSRLVYTNFTNLRSNTYQVINRSGMEDFGLISDFFTRTVPKNAFEISSQKRVSHDMLDPDYQKKVICIFFLDLTYIPDR